MNRIILIGNGFDKAHGLPTGYRDFMDKYWTEFVQNFSCYMIKPFEDELIMFNWANGAEHYCTLGIPPNHFFKIAQQIKSYDDLKQLIAEANQLSDLEFILSFKNEFWEHISQKSCLETWLDIENEYYGSLKKKLKDKDRNPAVRKLNEEFGQVKKRLEEYLTGACKQDVEKHESIKKAIEQPPKNKEIAISKRELLIREVYAAALTAAYRPDLLLKERVKESDRYLKNIKIKKTLFLNFNYTNTAKLYAENDDEVINIHGELNSATNPVIFGHGDELDDDYKEIEKTNNNDFLENIKSVQYHNTHNYKALLTFLQWEPYQVFVMGHSCGNSDRTLLNTIFEHPNCISIKPFYYQWKDKDSGTVDNYTDIIKNISRNFNDKQNLREIVVNKEYCEPLIPVKS